MTAIRPVRASVQSGGPPPPGGRRGRARPWLIVVAAVLAAAVLYEFGHHFGLLYLLVVLVVPTLGFGLYLAWQVDPAYVLCAGLFLTAFSGHWGYLGFPSGIDPDRYLLSFGILQVVLRAPRVRNRPPFRIGAAHVFMAVAVAYVLFSAHQGHTLGSKDALFKLIDSFGIVPFLIFLVAPLAFRTPHHRSVLLGTLVAMGLYLGLTTLFEVAHVNALVFPRYILNPKFGFNYGRGRGPFLDSVANGFACAVCAVAALVARTTWSHPRARLLASAVGLLALLASFLSLERSVWIGATAGILTMLIVARSFRRYLLPTIVLGAVAGVAALALIPSLSATVSERASQQSSVWDRENLLRAGLNMVQARPLTGFGWQTFRTESRLYFRQSPDYPLTATTFVVHNFILGYAVGLGLIGLALWLAAVVLGVSGALLTRGPPDVELWRAGLIAVAVMFAVIADFIPPSEFPNLALWLWAGVVYSARYERPGARRGASATAPAGRAAAARAVPRTV